MLDTPSSKSELSGSNRTSVENPDKVSFVSRFFFLNTIFTILLTVLLIVGGVLGYFSMTKQSQPDIDIAVANITTAWPGANPQSIEQQVTDEIETEITSVKNIKQIQIAEIICSIPEEILVLPQRKGNSSQQMKRFGKKALRKSITIWRKPSQKQDIYCYF